MTTKAIAARYEALSKMPCLIGALWPAHRRRCGGGLENNHLTSIANRKRDDMRTIRLCFNHHQAQSPLPVGLAYHKGSKKFRENFGTDDQLLALQNKLIGERNG